MNLYQIFCILHVALCSSNGFSFELRNSESKLVWQNAIVYQIYPRSMYDASADGIGDLKGITEKADYFVDLGVEILWLNPINKSPMKDFGYDISDYKEIDGIFGTMEDFNQLISAMNARGIKVVMDFVPNHTSDQHEWFKKSVQKDPRYKDFYVWKDPKGYNESGEPIPPNNWLSAFRYSAWQWSEERKQYYYHAFLKEQPDLNYRNPEVVQEMHNVLKFWLDKGVYGFRVDAVACIAEAEDVYNSNEQRNPDSGTHDPTLYAYLNHSYTTDLPLTKDILRGFKKVLETYNPDRLMMVESFDIVEKAMEYYGNDENPISDFPFNFLLVTKLKTRSDVTGTNIKFLIESWLYKMPRERWPNWVLGNHDQGRVASRLGKDLVDSLNMITILLPGTPVTYYGEEIGMENGNISYEETQDPAGCALVPDHYQEGTRDPERTPMQWDSTKFAGFTKGNKTWISVDDNYHLLNVRMQNETSQSHLKVYKALAQIRKQSTSRKGNLTFQVAKDNVMAFVRHLENSPSFMLVVNTSEETITVDTTQGPHPVPSKARVIIRSSSDRREETKPGVMLDLTSLNLIAGEGMLFQWN